MFLPQDDDYAQESFVKKATSMSNNVFERKLYEGFANSPEKDNFVFITAPSFGWYPINCKKLKIKGFSSTNSFCTVSYCSTYFGSIFSKTRALKKQLSKVISSIDFAKYDVCIMSAELHLPYLKCLKFMKHKLPRCRTIQFVPDLPQFNNRSKGLIYRFLRSFNTNKIDKYRTHYVDKYVLFSAPMAAKLRIENLNNWIVNYGISPDINFVSEKKDTDKKHIVFIGKIDRRNGVDLIFKASELFVDRTDIVFDFYGIPASEGISNEFFQNKSNLVFHGFIKPSEVLPVLLNSSILLSPRYPNEEYTKYSFPSKIFDYLAAYKPIVTFKLDCYPSELDKIFIYPKDVSVESLYESINYALSIKSVDKDTINNFLDKYSKEALVDRLIKLANEL